MIFCYTKMNNKVLNCNNQKNLKVIKHEKLKTIRNYKYHCWNNIVYTSHCAGQKSSKHQKKKKKLRKAKGQFGTYVSKLIFIIVKHPRPHLKKMFGTPFLHFVLQNKCGSVAGPMLFFKTSFWVFWLVLRTNCSQLFFKKKIQLFSQMPLINL